MIDFFEIIRRALDGPYSAEQDFALKILVPKLRALIRKHNIRYDPATPVPSDDSLADAPRTSRHDDGLSRKCQIHLNHPRW